MGLEAVVFPVSSVLAQLRPIADTGSDRNLGTQVVPSTIPQIDLIISGTLKGQNLFHSFQDFNVDTGRSVYFSNPAGVQNILSRVTGGNLSNIQGSIGVLGNANLFLINPSGIVFGPGAALDVQSSFVATTANAIQLGTTGLFSASASATSNLLEVNPSAFFFNTLQTQPIINQAKTITQLPTGNITQGLRVPNERSLLLVGGDVRLESGGMVTVFDGRVEIGGLATVGSIGLSDSGNFLSLNFPIGVTRSNVSVSGSSIEPARVTVAGRKGGTLVVNARNLDLMHGIFQAGLLQGLGMPNERGGDIEINATNQVIIQGIAPLAGFGISNTVESGARGDSGDIIIRTGTLRVLDGNQVSTSTIGSGRSGNIRIEASNIELIGQNILDLQKQVVSGMTSNVFPQATGKGGDLIITTQKLLVSNGAAISTGTLSSSKNAQGGDITINASNIEVIGFVPNYRAARSNIITGTIGGSDAGNLKITTNRLLVQNSGIINTGTTGQGKGGNLNISAFDLEVNDAGIGADAVGLGNAGNIEIKARNLILRDQASILTVTRGSGQGSAGTIVLRVRDTMQMENSTIATFSLLTSGGTIDIESKSIRLLGNSNIVTSVFNGAGGGGDITLSANSIIALNDSDILAFARDGKGGNVTLNTRAFFGQNYRPAPFGIDPATLDGNDRVDINASGSLSSGTIVTPDTSFIQNSLNQLPKETIDTTKLLANTCIVRKDKPEGTFYITGTGGLPTRPGDLPPSQYPTNTIVQTADRPWQKGDPIVEPQGFYQLTNGRLVMSRECSTNSPIAQP